MSRVPAAKRRRLSPPEDGAPDNAATTVDHKATFLKNAAKWDLEQDYETRPRKLKKQKENKKLPVRTIEGWVAPQPTAEDVKEEDDSDSFLGTGSEDEGDEDVEEEEEVEEKKPKIPARQQILEAKEELARIASLINEDPEEHIGALKTLQALAESENYTVKKLALATQASIFKDVIPGYRIRPLSEEKMQEKISKEVKKLRLFEQKLVSGYETYVKHLGKLAKSSGSDKEQVASLATVAVSCACNLLNSVPHFNFRSELLKILVGKLSTRKVDADFVRCREAMETLFQNDEDGNASLEAVTMLTKMMKSRNYHFDESVLNTFLHLRLLSEFAQKASYHSVDKAEEPTINGKKQKQKREFRTKRLRKELKEKKAIEKEFKEADAAVSHEERDRMQAETLKMVFVAYFRILKARSAKLMGAVLEGLARYAHLINQDFFGDILEALRDIIATAELTAAAAAMDDDDASDEDDDEAPERNLTRESLLCVITAFALLEGQEGAKTASALKLDLSYFITHLYRTLHPVALNPDIELSSKSLHLADPNGGISHADTAKINVQTTIVLLIRSLSSVLLPATSIRAVPPLRVAAFAKQLMTVSMHLPEKSCTAMLGLLNRITKTHGKKVAPLWNTEERRGDGVFDPLKPEIEGSNPFAGTVWEGEILRRHFAPSVREAVKGVEKNVLEASK
ncbi:uncharacterized protein yc1106_04908 [Curvularia clavata]|uniref:Nucleolar complex-associated protein 3 n=1 Tax=Curvularia clavata TaxID=95742 RepID=A0A9Q9DTC8_CURCL|nr:uncharacterized protein yc1106_04908 [Curvularia clavata]